MLSESISILLLLLSRRSGELDVDFLLGEPPPVALVLVGVAAVELLVTNGRI